MSDTWIMLLIMIFANMTEAMTGFGGTIIALTLGVQLYPLKTILPTLVLLNLVLSGYIVIRHHRGIEPELWREILPYAGVGLPVGMLAFHLLQGGDIRFFFGIFVLLFALFELAKQWATTAQETKPLVRWQAFLWLFAGGLMQGLYATGGPFVVYYASRKILNKHSFRSTLSALWLCLNVVVVAGYLWGGHITKQTLTMAAILLPGVLVGIVLGESLHARIPERVFRISVYVLLAGAGLSLLWPR